MTICSKKYPCGGFPNVRLRRLREHPQLRRLIQETHLQVDDLILPLFIKHGSGDKIPIQSMPGCYQLHLEHLADEIKTIQTLNIPAVILFGIPEHKDATGSDAYSDEGIMQRAIREIKLLAPDLLIISDICCCEFTDHGNCGFIHEQRVDNDATLELLQRQAISHVKAGADVLAPSGMMDGMVIMMRQALDEHGHTQIPILSYAVKYASSYYGPFREAAGGSAPSFGDRKTHQMNPANGLEALREAKLDLQEGADMLMVKPAGAYLDIIQRVRQTHPSIPLAAYQVSGEYAQIKAASQARFLDEQATVMESLIAIKRAGANMVITYFAKDVAAWLQA